MQSEDRELDVRGEIERLVRPLLHAFDESGLIKMAVDEEEFALEVVRRAHPRREATSAMHAAPEQTLPSAPERAIEVVSADVVGIFHAVRPVPSAGGRVAESQELGYVEALGIRNPVRAGRSGALAAAFVEDGDAVEYGQPLFGIEVDV